MIIFHSLKFCNKSTNQSHNQYFLDNRYSFSSVFNFSFSQQEMERVKRKKALSRQSRLDWQSKSEELTLQLYRRASNDVRPISHWVRLKLYLDIYLLNARGTKNKWNIEKEIAFVDSFSRVTHTSIPSSIDWSRDIQSYFIFPPLIQLSSRGQWIDSMSRSIQRKSR